MSDTPERGEALTLGPYWKDLSAAELLAILEQLPGDVRIGCNDVGNLAVLSAGDREYLGYIDFANGTLELYEQEHDDA